MEEVNIYCIYMEYDVFFSKDVRWEIYVYFDVFEDVIVVVVYLKIICLDCEIYVGIIR